MKKYLFIAMSAMLVSSSAHAFSLPKATDLGGDKVKLQTCLASEAQKTLTDGKLTKDNLSIVAKDISSTCATKLALKKVDSSTVEMASQILGGLLK